MAEIVDIQIELPSYSHSFIIRDVPLSSTILQVKTKISELCAGGPRLEGQRIIFRGRYLEDIEKLSDLYNPQDSPCLVFHLAVHPSAWSSSPPTNSQPQAQQPRAAVTASGNNNPLAYVLYLHQNALMTLMQGTVVQTGEFMHSKSLAVQLLERNGWQWPSILDEAFPQPSEGGLKYERTIIDGQLYLQLCNPDSTSTAIQQHALRVLSCTFSILKQPMVTHVPSRIIPSNSIPIPPHVNQVLQQLGLPQLPNHNPPANPIPNPIPNVAVFRPLLLPIALHIIRILLVLYFFAPARKPLFGLLIAWFLFELWQRGVFNNRVVPDQQAAAPRQDEPPAPQVVAQNGNANAAQQRGRQAPQINAFLETVANYNLRQEEEMIAGADDRQPTLRERMVAFVGLLTTTIHPAVWDRRRVLLRQREGRLRTEDVASQDNAEQSEQSGRPDDARAQRRAELAALHARRTPWVQRYVQRAVAGDWVDEAD